MNYKGLLFIGFIWIIAISDGYSQSSAGSLPPDTASYPYWIKMMQDPSVNFFDVQRAFNVYWKDRPVERSSGFKPFKRWEYMMQLYRINPDGSRKPADHVLREYQNYKATHPETRSSSGNWVNLGPFVLPTGKGYGGLGRLNAIAFDPANANIIWAGSPSGGLWKTTTGGNNWASTVDNLPTLGVSAILIDYTDPAVMYIGTGDRDAGDAEGMGVFRSVDGGATWAPWRNGMGNQVVGRLLMHPTDHLLIFAATSGGIFKTTDGGANWSLIISGNFKDIVFKADNPAILFAAADGNFYRSTDTGATFTQVTSGLPGGARAVIGVTAADANYVYFLITNGDSFKGLYRSTDAGLNFTLRSDTPNIMSWDCTGGSGGQAWYDLDIAVDPANKNIIYAGGVNCFKSTDGGTTWAINSHWWGDCSVPAVHADLHVLEWNPINGRLYAGNDGGIYYTSNGGASWPEITNGMPISQVYKIGQSATVRDKCINGYQDNGTSTFMGSYWNFTNGGDGMECAVDHKNAAYSYSTIYFGSIYRHYNNYSDLTVCSNGLYGIDESGAWITPFILDEVDPNCMFAGLKNIWRCNNVRASGSEISWSRISYNLDGSNSNDLSALEQSPANTGILYAARYDNRLFRTDNAHDATVTWTSLTANLPESGWVADLECHPTNPDVVYLSMNNKIFKSTDRGMTWTNISGTLPNVTYSSIAYYKNSNEGLYVSSNMGVFFKDGTMSDWVMFSDGLPVDASINETEIWYHPTDPAQDVIRAGTYGRGLWESDMYHTLPNAAFTSNKTTVLTGCPVDFTDLSSGVPTAYSWTFQGATTPSSYRRNPDSIYYNTPGNYFVKLVVSNEAGTDSVTLNNYILVSDTSLPVVNFSADDTTVCADGIVHFTESSGFCPTAWAWSFDPSTVFFMGGTSANSRNPVVLFNAEGIYSVSLTVTNANGNNTLTKTDYITVGGYTLPLQEDFSENTLPGCWQNIDNQGSGQRWQFNNPGNRDIYTETGGNGFAILDSDHYGYGNSQDADLITPPLDLTSFNGVTLSFQHHFEVYANETATLSYSINGGSTWNLLQVWVNSTNNPEIFSQDVTSRVAGHSRVKFKWNYTGTWGWWWAVDDINITGTIPGLWTGAVSANWNLPGNWSDGVVPGSSTDITIPVSSPNWPVFSGNLVLGTHCRNIIMKGASQLTVNGNLTIPAGREFKLTGNGLLKVAGNTYGKTPEVRETTDY
jgi:PKD repeat protein